MKGRVARIIPSSFIDGPGHRAVVFMQGCDMRCLYCHNPETRAYCDDCGECVPMCAHHALSMPISGRVIWDEHLCVLCGSCTASCKKDSSPRVLELEPDELVRRIAPTAAFIDGVTFSGGECGLQPGFICSSAKLLRELLPGRRFAVIADTNGGTEALPFRTLVDSLDGFIFDLKCPDPDGHLKLTGQALGKVLDNLAVATAEGKLVELRTVCIEGFTDNPSAILMIADLLAKLDPVAPLRLIPFRPQGVRGALEGLRPFQPELFLELVDAARTILGNRVLTAPD